jgi:large subunit ribosomal protein L30
MATKGNNKQIKVTLVRSYFGRLQRHKDTVRGLGLRRMHHTVTVQDTPEIRGMIASISDMLRVEE